MHRKLLLLVAMISFSTLCFAESCPDVGTIKQHSLRGWKAYDSDNDKPLPTKRLARFVGAIEQFTLAEWKASKDKLHSVMHCYYRDKNGSQLEAYLTKENLTPTPDREMWYQVSGSMHCAAGMDKCQFQQNLANQPQLANK
jgi:hypothetical protein